MEQPIPSQDASQKVQVGEQFGEQIVLTRADIAAFAALCGDFNPLHHDEDYAQQTRFGGIIACGPHIAARMMGLTATHFSKKVAVLGLEFTLHFHKPVRPDEAITLLWEVVKIEPKASLQGVIVSLEGWVRDGAGQVRLIGSGKLLLTDKL
jgi:acyl dehydratase